MHEHPTSIDTDVLIVGGGVAGCLAALEACEGGANVLVVDKAKMLERAGSVGGGVDQYLTAMNSGPQWDTPEYLLMHIPQLTDGLADMEVAERVVHEMPRVLGKLEHAGVDFTDPDTGDYLRTRAFGLPGEYHLNFDGTQFKYHIARAAKNAGTRLLGRTMVTELLVDEDTNRAYGAIGVNVRSGEWYVIRARAVIVATGDVNRISKNASGNPFDSWHYPYNTGDGHAQAYRVGAELVNMEFVEATLTPKGMSVQGTNSYAGMGAHFLNRHGERFMFKYDENGEKARRTMLIEGVMRETLAGNEPLYIDLRHLDQHTLEHFERTLGVDRETLPAFFAQKGIDIKRDPIEISVSELSIRRGGVYFRGSGLVVDANSETNIAGLYGAGDCSLVSGGIAGASALGAIAGREAARRVTSEGERSLPTPAPQTLAQARAQLVGPLDDSRTVSWWDFEDDIREVVTTHAGFQRTEKSLLTALEAILSQRGLEEQLSAHDLHDLMRAHESRNIAQCVELMVRAAIERRESRSGAAHNRLDHPERDDEHWRQLIVVRRGEDGAPAIHFEQSDAPVVEDIEDPSAVSAKIQEART